MEDDKILVITAGENNSLKLDLNDDYFEDFTNERKILILKETLDNVSKSIIETAGYSYNEFNQNNVLIDDGKNCLLQIIVGLDDANEFSLNILFGAYCSKALKIYDGLMLAANFTVGASQLISDKK